MTRYDRVFFAAFGVLLLVGCLVQLSGGYVVDIDQAGSAWGADDAYISYRYAENFAHGRGLVYNAGGDHVEGYSNFLFVLLVAPAALVSSAAMFVWATALNIVATLLAYAIFVRHVASKIGPFEAKLAAVLFATWPSIWVWAASGMETSLVLFLEIGALAAADRAASAASARRPAAVLGAWLVALTLVRADGFVFALPVLLSLVLRRAWRPAGIAAAAVALVLAVHLGFRLAYYGYPLPNTYYAKVAVGTRATRLGRGCLKLAATTKDTGLDVYLGAALFGGSVALYRSARAWAGRAAEGASAIPLLAARLSGLAVVAYWVYVGGDLYVERFLLVVMPIGTIILLDLVRPSEDRRRALLAAILVLVHVRVFVTSARHELTTTKYDRWIVLGKYVAEHFPDKTLATGAAGKLPFFSRLPTVDIFGLNDGTIAHKDVTGLGAIGHDKSDLAYVFATKPDLFAAWIDPSLDMLSGPRRAMYLAEGYEIRLLVRGGEGDGAPIVDVSGYAPTEISRLIENNYPYAVIARLPGR